MDQNRIMSMSDPELIAFLAEKGMGWPVFDTSVHRTGTRPIPHAWRWGDRVMVFMGGSGLDSNREWNPVEREEDCNELIRAVPEIAERVPDASRFVHHEPDGTRNHRAFCIAIAELFKEPSPDAPDIH
jgi:hypothetical protein